MAYTPCVHFEFESPLLYQVDRIAFFHMTSTSCGLSCTDALPMSCCSPCGDVFSIACDVGVGRSTFVGRCAQGGPPLAGAIGCWSYVFATVKPP